MEWECSKENGMEQQDKESEQWHKYTTKALDPYTFSREKTFLMILRKPLNFFGKSKVLSGLGHRILFVFLHLNHILPFNLNFLKPCQRKFLLRQSSIIQKLRK